MHGSVRVLTKQLARRGDAQGRLIADPAVRVNPVPFFTELRELGPIFRCRLVWMTVDHRVANDILRSDDFRVLSIGAVLPKPMQWVLRHTKTGLLHPLEPPSMLSVEPPDHTRYRKLVSSVFTTRAVAALRDRVTETAESLLDELAEESGVVDVVERYCSQLPVTVIGDILGVPDDARPHILEFGELGAPSLDIGLTWQQYQQVYRGIEGFNGWLSNHLHELRRNPGDDLMSQIIQASDEGARLNHEELLATAGLVLAAGFETTVNLLGNGIRMLLEAPEHLETLAARPELWPNAVEEILRLDSPVQFSARMARKRHRDRGHRGPATAKASSSIWPGPTATPRYSTTRTASTSSATTQASTCRSPAAGTSALARRWPARKAKSGLRTFFERFPDARLAGDGSRRDTRVLRGWSSLPIALREGAHARVSS